MEKKSLEWIDSKLAGKLKIIDGIAQANGTTLEELVNKMVEDDKASIKCLDESALRLKLHGEKVRNTYKEIAEGELKQINDLYAKYDDIIFHAKERSEGVIKSLSSCSERLRELQATVSSFNFYKFDQLFEVIKRFENMSAEEKDLLTKLLSTEGAKGNMGA